MHGYLCKGLRIWIQQEEEVEGGHLMANQTDSIVYVQA